jgi:hypothetical protein
MGKLKDWAIGKNIDLDNNIDSQFDSENPAITIKEKEVNKYIVELSIPTIETYEIESDIPLTRSEIISRVQNKNPKFMDYGNEDHEIVAMEGKLEEE